MYFQMKVDEQTARIAELESCVERSAMDADRRLTQHQQEYERRIQLLMKQVADADQTSHSDLASQLGAKDSKLVAFLIHVRICIHHMLTSSSSPACDLFIQLYFRQLGP
jgi:hypothetical protein